MFSLVPVEGMPSDNERRLAAGARVDMATLRAEAVAAGRPAAPARTTRAEYRSRSDSIGRYVLARAGGTCEACGRPAPFSRADGTPYLEIHHTRRLADEGPDDIMHVAAVCPNCHREAHFGPGIDGFGKQLEKVIAKKEGTHRQAARADA